MTLHIDSACNIDDLFTHLVLTIQFSPGKEQSNHRMQTSTRNIWHSWCIVLCKYVFQP